MFVLGLKGPATAWCERVMSELMSEAGSPLAVTRVASAAEALKLFFAKGHPVVLTCSRPDATLRQALSDSEMPLVIAGTSPEASVRFLADEAGSPPIDQTRDVLSDLASLVAVARSEKTLLVPEDAPAKGVLWVRRMAEHLALNCSEETATSIAQSASVALSNSAPTPDRQNLGEASGEDEACLRGLLTGLGRSVADGAAGSITVTRRMLLVADSGEPAVKQIDATGRPRILVYGPYLAIPPGDWTARCVYGFSGQLVGTSMAVDVVHFTNGFHQLARTTFNVTSQGRHEVHLGFSHDKPEALLEIRLFCEQAIFDGQISVGYIELKPRVGSQSASEAAQIAPSDAAPRRESIDDEHV